MEKSIGFDSAAFSISKSEFRSQYLENIRIADEADAGDFSYKKIGDTDFYLTADISKNIMSYRLKEHYRKLFAWIVILCLLLFFVSYVTILHFSKKLIDLIGKLNSQMIQNERYAAIGQIGSGLAHDLNNRLHVIIGNSELLMKEELPLTLEQKLKAIHSESWKASETIKQLYHFSMHNINRNENVRIRDFLEKSVNDLIRTSDLTINLDLKISGELFAPLDKNVLNAAITEFLKNASEAEASQVDLSASLCVNESGKLCSTCRNEIKGEWLCLSLKDNGRGLYPDSKDHELFEPFFSTKGPGHPGLGLTKIYGAVHQHQGHIMLNKSLEQGFGLLLYFPLKE